MPTAEQIPHTGWFIVWALFIFAAYAGLKRRYRKQRLSRWILIVAILTIIVIPAGLVFSIGIMELAIIGGLIAFLFLSS